MKITKVLLGVLEFASISSLVSAQLSNVTTPSLNITAVAATNGSSVLQCWQLPGFMSSAVAGTAGALNLYLGDMANASYTVLPPRYDGGLHRAPAPQIVFFVSGLAHVTLPNTTESATTSAWVQGGKYGLIIAVDTPDVSQYGHISTYPSDSTSIVFQVPFKDGKIPEHSILHDGPCGYEDMTGI